MNIEMGMSILNHKNIEKYEFDKIMEEHKKWLEDHNTGKRADFSDMDLSNMDLSGLDFSYAKMDGVNLHNSNLSEANLSYVDLNRAFMMQVNLSKAIIDRAVFTGADITHSKLDECKGERAFFTFACMWDCSIKNATLHDTSFMDSKVCDCDFTGSDLEESCFAGADLDNAVFVNTNLKNTDFCYVSREYWSDFKDSDMTGAILFGADMDNKRLEGVKGLHLPMFCPEEGTFIAWKKCREEKIVKLFIPEHAHRKAHSIDSCRASEAVVMEIYDKEGNTVNEAVSLIDENFRYVKGETVLPEEKNPNCYGDVTGIYFFLSRKDAVVYENPYSKKEDD